ncbi:hypothetical protein AB0I53_46615 [Saccharopolyspora sp. NPDC050389]|uniref:hypothetical protein n=1 Tax=Saccharopolyspora sp. NPDC050389 TaxID=3155516 RepID=UPI0033EF96C6
MQEELLREGMRAAVDDEPPLGFSPDDLVAEGKRRQRRRRATIGAVAATLVVLAGAAAVPGMMTGPTPIAPAAPQVSAVKPIEWPPKGMAPMSLPESQLIAEGERIRGHLAEIIPKVDTGAFDVTTTQPHGLGSGFGTEAPATVIVRANFKYGLPSQQPGMSVDLPMRLTVVVQGPGTVSVQPAQACGDGDEPTQAVLSCTLRTLDDGSIVVESVTASRGEDGPKTHIVRHFRTGGTVVSATASHSAGQEAAGLSAYRQVQVDRLDQFATDPEFALPG